MALTDLMTMVGMSVPAKARAALDVAVVLDEVHPRQREQRDVRDVSADDVVDVGVAPRLCNPVEKGHLAEDGVQSVERCEG